jgi:hypothetical protein
MKIISALLIFLATVICSFSPVQEGNIEFVCHKMNKASNTCYFNFIVDGGRFRYEDVGCKRIRKKEDTIKKIKEGKLGLAKDWKIDCPEVKK